MAERVATLQLLYASDLSKARAEYNAYKQYVEENPPVIRFNQPGSPGAGPASTFGGGSTASGAGSIPTSAAASAAAIQPTASLVGVSNDSPALIADRAAFFANTYGSRGGANTAGIASMVQAATASATAAVVNSPVNSVRGGFYGTPATEAQREAARQDIRAAWGISPSVSPAPEAATARSDRRESSQSDRRAFYPNRTSIAGVPVNPNGELEGPQLASGAFNTADDPEPRRRRDPFDSLRRRLGVGYLTYEATRLGQSYIDEQQQLGLNEGNLPGQLQAYLKLNQTLGSFPIVGQVADIWSQGLERLPGFGGSKPGSTRTSVFVAEESIKDVMAGDARTQSSNEINVASRTLINQAVGSSWLGPLTQRREAIGNEYNQAVMQRDLQERNLQAQINGETDIRQKNRLQLQLNELRQQDTDVLLPALGFNRDAGYANLGREVRFQKTSLGRRQNQVAAMSRGEFGRADEIGFENGLQDELDRAGDIERPLVEQNNQQARARRRLLQGETLQRSQSEVETQRLVLENRPLAAQLNDIAEQRREALGAAPLRVVDQNALADARSLGERMMYGGAVSASSKQLIADQQYNDQTLAAINTKYDQATALAQKQDQLRRFSVGLSTQGIEQSTARQQLRNRFLPRTADVQESIDSGVNAIEAANASLIGPENDQLRQRRIAAIRGSVQADIYGQIHPTTFQGEFAEASPFVMRGNPGDLRYKDLLEARKRATTADAALNDATGVNPLAVPGGWSGGMGFGANLQIGSGILGPSLAAQMAEPNVPAGKSSSGGDKNLMTQEQGERLINLLTQLIQVEQQANG